MSNIIGIRNNNTIVPYSAATKRTKQLSFVKTTDITATSAGSLGTYLVTRAAAVFYTDSSGNWRFRFNGRISCDANSRTGLDWTFTNIVFKSTTNFSQAVTVAGSGLTAVQAFCVANEGRIVIEHPTASPVWYSISFDVELNAEPTTYTTTANMEGVTAVDVFISPASSSETGLVDTSAQTFSGTKTFNGGIKFPTSDPHVAGAWWDNAGTLTKSSG